MKIIKTPITLIALFAFVGLAFIYGCKKEDPLKPNPDMEIYQNEHYAGGDDWGGFGDTTGTGDGTDTTGGGGGVNVNEHFTVDIDGVSMSFSNPVFQSTFIGDQIINDPLSPDNQIQITRFSGFSVDTFDYPTIGFFKNQSAYESIDGRLVIDSLTADFIKGTFYCNVVLTTGSDTISLTNGSFKVAK